MRQLFTILTALNVAVVGTLWAAEPPVLTVMTYDSFVTQWGPGPQVEAAFETTCKCDLQFVGAGDGAALLARIRLEGKRSDADIVLGLDTSLTAQARATGLFADHGLPEKDYDLPVPWSDPIFIPYDWGYFAFVYDNTKLTAPPASFDDLINAPKDLKIVIQDPRSSTPGLGLLLWVKSVYGDDAPGIWEALSPRILTVTKGWSEAYGMFLAGEADMVLSYTTSPSYHLIAENDATKAAASFSDGHYMQIEVAAKLASSDQPELADAFLDFMTSERFQSIIPTTNWMYPVVMTDNIPDGFDTFGTPDKTLLFSDVQAASVRDEALSEWLAALSR